MTYKAFRNDETINCYVRGFCIPGAHNYFHFKLQTVAIGRNAV